MIAKESIDKVFDAARVEEVIGDFVQLKKAGINFKGLSPFTDERTPSFIVSPVKQIWKDFSSGKGGNAVAFLMEHEHFTYPEAIRYLAKKYGIEIEETEQSSEAIEEANERESLFVVSEFAQKVFQDNLWQTDKGKAIGLSYFKERGFTNETIEKFKLGYVLDEWTTFTDFALEKGYKKEFLEKTGLSSFKEDKYFDKFKGRVMFPIHSMSGRVLGFGGRILNNAIKAAKYLNSPESEIYHKSKILYGIYHAKQAIAKQDNCFLVEGYTDVIQLHQSGIENVVASSGTALTEDQVRLVNRLTKNITVLYDGDAAGLRASIRGIDIILEQGMNVRVCTFPEGEDPDSFARNNSREDILKYLEANTKDFLQFKASFLMKDAVNDPIKKADTIRDMMTSISKIPDRIKQEVYIKECSQIMNVSEDVLFSGLAQLTKKEIRDAGRQQKKQQAFDVVKNANEQVERVDVSGKLEQQIINYLIQFGRNRIVFKDSVLIEGEVKEEEREMFVFEKFFLELQQDEVEFSDPIFRQIYNLLLEHFSNDSNFDAGELVNIEDREVGGRIVNIIMEHEKYSLHDWNRMNIFPKDKNVVESEDILNVLAFYRMFLITEIVNGLIGPSIDAEILQDINLYNGLRNKISEKHGLHVVNLGFFNSKKNA